MKKPEFPKPRLIREDVLPEQDPMIDLNTKYRIKKITKSNGKVQYHPQKKFLWFWMNLADNNGFSCEDWAQDVIFEDYEKILGDKVEFLPVDSSRPVPPVPNPPPDVV